LVGQVAFLLQLLEFIQYEFYFVLQRVLVVLVQDFFHDHFVFVAVLEVLQYVGHELRGARLRRHQQPDLVFRYICLRIEFVLDQVVLAFVVLPIYFLPVEVVPDGPRHVPQRQPRHPGLILRHKLNVARVHALLQGFRRFFGERVAHDVVPRPHDARLEYAPHLLVRRAVARPRKPGVPVVDARPLLKPFAELVPEPRENVHDLLVKVHVDAVREQLHKVLAVLAGLVPRVQQLQRVGGPVRAFELHVRVNPCKRFPVGRQQAAHA